MSEERYGEYEMVNGGVVNDLRDRLNALEAEADKRKEQSFQYALKADALTAQRDEWKAIAKALEAELSKWKGIANHESKTVTRLNHEIEALEAERDELRELIRSICPPAWDDERMDYVEVQIDKDDYARMQALKGGGDE